MTGNRELKPSGVATGASEPSLKASKTSANWALRDELWVIVWVKWDNQTRSPSTSGYSLPAKKPLFLECIKLHLARGPPPLLPE